MRLSKRTEYGLRAVVQLARLWPQHFVQSRDLSKLENLPNKFLESILLALRRGGFLESKVGSGGGYRLSRSPKDIVVGDVLRRLDVLFTNVDPPPGSNDQLGEIAVKLISKRLTDANDEVLDAMTLDELLEQVTQIGKPQQEMYYI